MESCGEVRRGPEIGKGQYHIREWWIKIGRDTSGPRDPSHTPDHPAQGSSTRKINPHNFQR